LCGGEDLFLTPDGRAGTPLGGALWRDGDAGDILPVIYLRTKKGVELGRFEPRGGDCICAAT